jgi:hypothetical protein
LEAGGVSAGENQAIQQQDRNSPSFQVLAVRPVKEDCLNCGLLWISTDKERDSLWRNGA